MSAPCSELLGEVQSVFATCLQTVLTAPRLLPQEPACPHHPVPLPLALHIRPTAGLAAFHLRPGQTWVMRKQTSQM